MRQIQRPMKLLKTLGWLSIALLLVTQASAAMAAEDGQRDAQVRPKTPGLEKAARAQSKIDAHLTRVLDRISAQGITRSNAVARNVSGLSDRLVRIKKDGQVQVYIHVDAVTDEAQATLGAIESQIEIANSKLNVIQAWIPFDRVEQVAALPFVSKVTRPSYARTRAGSVQTEGDAILRANELRADGFNGAGVKIGVISDGANSVASAQASNDLPNNITFFGTCFITPGVPGSCDEGTAMMEIIHDLAPGAQLAIGEVNTNLDFIQRVDDLANTFGADIIVDDLGFFEEPFFEDGGVAQAVAGVANQVIYVSAAGNDGQGHYEEDFDGTNLGGLILHDFGSADGRFSDTDMELLIDPGEIVVIYLQWNDRFGQSDNDYDLFLVGTSGGVPLCPSCSSVAPQTGIHDPLEIVSYQNNTGSTVRALVEVQRFAGANRRLELFILTNSPDSVVDDPYNDPKGSIFGHPAANGALAIGAIDALDPGNDTIQPYSSRGPSRIDFPFLQTRSTPAVTGIDGVSVTGAGGFGNVFFGTSAAAPHIAAIAALLIQKAPSADQATIISAMTDTAVDLGPSGRDGTYGFGRVDAVRAADALEVAPPPPPPPPAPEVTLLPWLKVLILE